ncbi:hypothetical protein Cgig2_022498 [Carnegiea gigantea]|uniref:Uncharacterized protein n=1 Tax=Carnegiea gigantea TaxID=171969 RepID=A0A9Q1K8L0_9CARY|nr:hypothetical protein Cgig2_022498 [Carnegiea gigantea]
MTHAISPSLSRSLNDLCPSGVANTAHLLTRTNAYGHGHESPMRPLVFRHQLISPDQWWWCLASRPWLFPPGGGERGVAVRAARAISAVAGRSLERRLEVFSGGRRRCEGQWFPVVSGKGGFSRRQRRCRTEGGLGMGVGVVTRKERRRVENCSRCGRQVAGKSTNCSLVAFSAVGCVT